MNRLTLLFSILLALIIYKLTYLTSDVPNTHHRFTIYRDQHGIPRIHAKTHQDLIFGLGYAAAQDRMWTLHFKRMLLRGQLAEMFGPEVVQSDLEMRNIGFLDMGRTNLKHTDPATIKLLQAYIGGVNEYARSCKMLPIEFYLLWLEWEDYTVEDVLANINFLSFTLQFDWFYEIARQRLLETVGFDLGVKTITYGGQNIFRNTTIVSDEQLKKWGRYEQYDFDKQKELLQQHWAQNNISLGSVHFPQFEFSIEGSGSNAWVISGEHSQSGKPMLASDPHLASMIPSIFYAYETVLLGDDNQIVDRRFGVGPDGFPTMSIGVSPVAAWGATAAYIDNKDVYYETVRNNSGTMQYLFKDEWHDFRLRKETIKVRGGDTIEEVFYHTHRGVVLQTIFMDMHWKYGYPLPQKYRDNHTLSLVASHFLPDNSSAKGLLCTLTHSTIEQFTKCNHDIQNPNIDSPYILKNGSIGYVSVGALPKRKMPQMGSFIKNGNSDLYDMDGFLPQSQKPHLLDPEKGYFAMCNNRFASDHYQHRSSLSQIVTGRAFRLDKIIREKLNKGDKFDMKMMKSMQLDERDEFVAEVLPKMLGRLTHLRKIWSNSVTEQLFERLNQWNFHLSADSVEASIYHVWEYLFQHSLFSLSGLTQEETEAIINHGFFENYQFTLLEKVADRRLTDEERPVCESKQTRKYPQLHPCDVSVALAFKNLPDELKTLFKSDQLTDYKWGIIHQQTFKNIPWSEVPLLGKIWNRDFPRGGNSRTLNVAIFTHQSRNYFSRGSASFRIVSDIETSWFNLEVGESDRVSSPYYDNFVNNDTYVQYEVKNPALEGLPKGWSKSVDTTV